MFVVRVMPSILRRAQIRGVFVLLLEAAPPFMSSRSVCFTHTHLHTHPWLVHSVYCVGVVRKAGLLRQRLKQGLEEDRKHKQVIVFVCEDVTGQRFQ